MSRHTIVVGITESGKSLFLKAMALLAASQGKRVIVYDPTLSSGWPETAIKYGDAEAFLNDIMRCRSAYVFIDEAADLWAFDQVTANKILYRGRHLGLAVYVAGQRLTMIRPNARDQCPRLVAFRQQKDDAMALRARHPRMEEATQLPPMEGLITDGFTIQRIRVDHSPPRVSTIPEKVDL